MQGRGESVLKYLISNVIGKKSYCAQEGGKDAGRELLPCSLQPRPCGACSMATPVRVRVTFTSLEDHLHSH